MNILIVDDTPINQKLLRAQLESEGHAVFEAHDGVDALALLEQQRVDVVISDILMPRMDGYRLCHEIRKHARLHDLRIILYTATYTSPGDAKLALDVGADKYLTKPASVETLAAALHEVIAQPHAAPCAEGLGEVEVFKEYSEQLVNKLEEKNTELQAQTEALQQSEERYRLLFERAPVAIFSLAPTGAITSLNHAFETITGWPLAQWLGRPFHQIMHPDDQPRAVELFQMLLRRQHAPSFDLRMRTAAGGFRDVEFTGFSTEFSGGRIEVQGIGRDITERKTTELALREKTNQLRTLSRRILETQETERRRVAHELHDELGQALTAIKINLQMPDRLQKQSPDELNTENLRIVDDALQQVRRLALALRPSMLDDLGLLPALRWMAGQTAERSGFTVEFDTAMPEVRLAPEIETACFRIVQESLTNIARHAQAQRVEIALHRTGDALMLSVQDDGCGFDLAAMRGRAVAGGSIGVLGMQERAELIGGQLDIESTPGQGSTVRLRCPLRRRGDAA